MCKAFRDAAVLMLPQVPDNEANGRLGLARRVKTFMLICQNEPGTKCYRQNLTQPGFKALNIFKKMNLHKNFHEMFGLISIAIFLLIPLSAGAEVIYLKDGTTVKAAKVWEEDGLIRFYLEDYEDITITYSKEIVERIEKGDGKAKAGLPKTKSHKKASTQNKQIAVSEPGKPKSAAKKPKSSPPLIQSEKESKPAAAKNSSTAAGARQTSVPPEKPGKTKAPMASQSTTPQPDQNAVAPEAGAEQYSQLDGVQFYDPRRTYKYWSSPATKHRTLKEVIAALAQKFNRSPEWVAQNLGDTNDLGEIYRNLGRAPVKTAALTPSMIETEGIPFYDPRRPYKYQLSEKLKFHTLGEAVNILAQQYDRSPQWIKDHLGESNDIADIHRNLAQAKADETGK